MTQEHAQQTKHAVSKNFLDRIVGNCNIKLKQMQTLQRVGTASDQVFYQLNYETILDTTGLEQVSPYLTTDRPTTA